METKRMCWKRGNWFTRPFIELGFHGHEWSCVQNPEGKNLSSRIKDFAAKNPGTPATSDIVIEYVLADDDFTCNVSVDGTPAVAVKFAYSGDMENQIGDEVSLKLWGIDLFRISLHVFWNNWVLN